VGVVGGRLKQWGGGPGLGEAGIEGKAWVGRTVEATGAQGEGQGAGGEGRRVRLLTWRDCRGEEGEREEFEK